MKNNFNFSRKADHFIVAEFVGKNNAVKDVFVELYLPRNENEEILLNCKPNPQQYKNLMDEYEYSINAYDEFSDGNINNTFRIERAFCKKMYSTFYTSKLSDFNIILQAYDLMIICEKGKVKENGESEGYFTIFNRFEIPPLKHLQRKPNGEVTVESNEKYSFVLESGLKLTFDTYYKYENIKDYIKSFPYSVAEYKTNIDPEKINEIILEIDDFLLLVSLALEKICLCTGWVAYSNSKIVRYLRRDRTIPDRDTKRSYSDYLIEPFELKTFLEKSYNAFINFNDRNLLRNILFPIVRKKKISVETHYLILFAILESTVLNYKKNNKYEPILPPDDFNVLKDDLEKFIKKKLNSDENMKERRKFIYEKLPELNRISFKSSFELFQNHYKIYVGDLWPLIESKEGATLAHIRNKIIHGEIFSNHQFNAVRLAMEHLQIIVERIVFTLLNWDISNTKVSLEYVKQYHSKEFEKVKYYQKLFNE